MILMQVTLSLNLLKGNCLGSRICQDWIREKKEENLSPYFSSCMSVPYFYVDGLLVGGFVYLSLILIYIYIYIYTGYLNIYTYIYKYLYKYIYINI